MVRIPSVEVDLSVNTQDVFNLYTTEFVFVKYYVEWLLLRYFQLKL